MKRKLFTLLTLLLCACSGAWADEAILSWYLGTDGAAATSGNSITGASGSAAEGFTIAITGNTSKNWSNGNGDITYNKTTYKTLKNSNGAQNTVTCPTGYVATKVVFYVTSNADAAGKLSEFDGSSCDDEVSSIKNYTNYTTITKTLDNKSSFTFTFSSKQVCFIAVVTYSTPKPNITTQPVPATYQKDATATALTVVATASIGDLTYQWYSCYDTNKTNAAAIDAATSASYTPATSATGTFYYFCRVTDTNGSSDSDVATITVANAYAPNVTPTATSVEVLQFEAATLGVTVDAVPAATIQWYSCDDAEKTNAAAIDGATNATYSPSTENIATYYFYAVASNAQGATSSNVITLTVNKDITGTAFYSWDQGTETGGTAEASDGESVGCSNSTYTTIRLNGKNDFSTNIVTITLHNALKAGDQIKVTAYRNKSDKDKQAAFKAKFEFGSTNVSSSTGLEFVNIDNNSGDSNYGSEPNTCVFTVPASAAGSKTITMTRSHTSTNLFITKLEVYRPTINFSATLNAAGLLTADEISDKAAFSFGVTSIGERVAVDAPNAVATISGTYHNDHGCTGLTVTADVTKPVKITIGQCSFSKSLVTIKNSSSENVIMLNPNSPACWKNDASKVDVFYYTGAATTLTISGMSYCPFVAIEEIDAEDAIISITPAYNKTTYVTTMPLDFSNVEGLKAYVATNAANGSVTLEEVSAVPAGTPLMLIGTAETEYTVPVAASASAPAKNMFVAGDGTTEFNASTYDYILYSDGKFYQIGSGTVATTKAYLHCDSDPTVNNGSRGLTLVFGGEATGISSVNGDEVNAKGYFNLSGQRVSQPSKGLYIVEGKKVIIK